MNYALGVVVKNCLSSPNSQTFPLYLLLRVCLPLMLSSPESFIEMTVFSFASVENRVVRFICRLFYTICLFIFMSLS